MSTLECKNLAEQIFRILYLNKFSAQNKLSKSHFDLFNLNLSNLGSSSNTKYFFESLYGPYIENYYPNVICHERTFEEVFPNDKIVYLSPHSEETITHFDYNAIYVIGGIVDRRQVIELTSTKCKQIGLKTLKLPRKIGNKTFKEIRDLVSVFEFMYMLKFGLINLNDNSC